MEGKKFILMDNKGKIVFENDDLKLTLVEKQNWLNNNKKVHMYEKWT